jgi:hypothetical protein
VSPAVHPLHHPRRLLALAASLGLAGCLGPELANFSVAFEGSRVQPVALESGRPVQVHLGASETSWDGCSSGSMEVALLRGEQVVASSRCISPTFPCSKGVGLGRGWRNSECDLEVPQGGATAVRVVLHKPQGIFKIEGLRAEVYQGDQSRTNLLVFGVAGLLAVVVALGLKEEIDKRRRPPTGGGPSPPAT